MSTSTAFATAEDLAKTLNRTFSPAEEEWIDELLDQASTYLRSIIGQNIYPEEQVTYTAYPTDGREDIPQGPVVSVDKVERNGNPVQFMYRPGYIIVDSDEPVEVTFTYGYKKAPRELNRLAQVLVSQTLLTLENELGLTAGGLSSVALDDFRIAFANAGDATGMALTKHAEKAVKQQFGRGNVYTIATRS